MKEELTMAKEVSKETMEFIRQMKTADAVKAVRPVAPKPAPAPLPIDKAWDSLDESQRTNKTVFHDAPPVKKKKSWPSNPLRWGKPIALVVLTLSTYVFFVCLFSDVSVESENGGRINNIGLIAYKQVGVLGSGILMFMSFFYMVASTALSVVLQALEMSFNKESAK